MGCQCALVLLLSASWTGVGWAAEDETIVVFDRAEVRWGPDDAPVQPKDGYIAIEHGRVIETTVQLPPAPADQRDARGIVLSIEVEPVVVEGDDQPRFADAWTRMGCVSIVPRGDASDADAEPPHSIELMRFMTGFGGTSTLSQDVTCFAPLIEGETTIRVEISTSKDPAWRVSLRVRYIEGEAGYRRPIYAEPLFSEARLTRADNHIATDVDIPANLARPRVRILSTGHGGGQEFLTATHILSVDGREVARWRPWREDGGTRHADNPATRRTNIDGRELWSSDIDRAGWMPATVVEPLTIPLPELTPGPHTIKLEVLEIYAASGAGEPNQAGGYWVVTAIVVADEPWPIN